MSVSRHLFQWRDALLSERGPTSAIRRHVLLVLSMDADMDGGNCFPSTRRLAKRTGLSRRRLEGHLRAAEIEGWVGRSRIGEGQGWRRTLYVLKVPDVETQRPHVDIEGGDGVSPPNPGNVGTERPHLEPERGDAVAGRGDVGGTNVGTERPLTSLSTSPTTSSLCDESHDGREKRNNFPSLAKLPLKGRNRIYPPEFEGAFAALPARHVAHSKAGAYRAWRVQVRTAEEVFQLDAASSAYAQDVRKRDQEGTEFVMMASTFFGPAERWRPYSGIEPPRPAQAPMPAPGGGFYAA